MLLLLVMYHHTTTTLHMTNLTFKTLYLNLCCLIPSSIVFSMSLFILFYFYIYRRLVEDDGRGVAEALNETACIRENCTTGLTVSPYPIMKDHNFLFLAREGS